MNNKQIEIYAAGKTVYCNMVENGEKTGEGYYTFPQNMKMDFIKGARCALEQLAEKERMKPKKTDFCTVGGEEIYTGDICQIYINQTFIGTQRMDQKIINTLEILISKKISVAFRKVNCTTDIPSDNTYRMVVFE
ncbi:MAG: hypothetical protein ACLROI_12475 [Beduini sp.]|uniref:hypothetical protein n=1 Tax=Beduini sp. TaxID=1922300 RepID=UPI003990DCD4